MLHFFDPARVLYVQMSDFDTEKYHCWFGLVLACDERVGRLDYSLSIASRYQGAPKAGFNVPRRGSVETSLTLRTTHKPGYR